MKKLTRHGGRDVAQWPVALLLLSLLCAGPAFAQSDDQTRAQGPACGTERADPAAASPERLVLALYEIVSGPANGHRERTAIAASTQRPSNMSCAFACCVAMASPSISFARSH